MPLEQTIDVTAGTDSRQEKINISIRQYFLSKYYLNLYSQKQESHLPNQKGTLDKALTLSTPAYNTEKHYIN